MLTNVKKIPEEIENLIKDYVFSYSFRLQLLLDKYPLYEIDNLIKDIQIEQLDKIYKEGCIYKIFIFTNRNCTCKIRSHIDNLFNIYPNTSAFLWEFYLECYPKDSFNNFWITNNNYLRPCKSEYINNIKEFCIFIFRFSKERKNEYLINFCDKLLYELLVGILIIRKSKII